ncbi:import inner membrane translocase subunit tim23-related [Anaeramoeba ignava]|uniref:Import inner membrane translocase subunit tim23-related n=1 Tax=Anaeramoeba ignava TaxID=1746090 RepID=A0A9Q0LC84_ANAIG|nr:import inner membrane translocase subunit tim23-related [Anaeramoeba ignava]
MEELQKIFQLIQQKAKIIYEEFKKSDWDDDFKLIGKHYFAGIGFGILEGTRKTFLTNQVKKGVFLDHTFESCLHFSQKLAGLSFIYLLIKNTIEKQRGIKDEYNHIVAGAGTGILYKTFTSKSSTSKLFGAAFGALTGYLIARKDEINWNNLPSEFKKVYSKTSSYLKDFNSKLNLNLNLKDLNQQKQIPKKK